MIYVINSAVMLFVGAVWGTSYWYNKLWKCIYLALAMFNGFEAYRIYFLGA